MEPIARELQKFDKKSIIDRMCHSNASLKQKPIIPQQGENNQIQILLQISSLWTPIIVIKYFKHFQPLTSPKLCLPRMFTRPLI